MINQDFPQRSRETNQLHRSRFSSWGGGGDVMRLRPHPRVTSAHTPSYLTPIILLLSMTYFIQMMTFCFYNAWYRVVQCGQYSIHRAQPPMEFTNAAYITETSSEAVASVPYFTQMMTFCFYNAWYRVVQCGQCMVVGKSLAYTQKVAYTFSVTSCL